MRVVVAGLSVLLLQAKADLDIEQLEAEVQYAHYSMHTTYHCNVHTTQYAHHLPLQCAHHTYRTHSQVLIGESATVTLIR